MSEIQYWNKFIKKVKYAVVVEVHEGNVTIDADLFHDLMTNSGWRLMERLIQEKQS